MSKMLFKSTLRDIKSTKARFLSIFLIILIGVGFFTGIKSSKPSMMAVVDEYYDDTKLMDFRLLSTVGFDDADIEAIKEIDGVTDVQAGFFTDVFLGGDAGGSVVRLHAFRNDDNALNKPTVVSGRLPENENEAVAGVSSMGSVDVGSEVYFTLTDSDINDVLKETEFTIVGQVESPLYISFDRGTTNIGNGSISLYMLLPEESFATERYTEVFVKTEISHKFSPYTEEYDNAIDEMTSKFEDMGTERVEAFMGDTVKNAQSSLDEAKATFEKEKANALKELQKARDELDKGWEEFRVGIADGEAQLADALKQIEDGRKQLEEGKKQFEQGIKDGQTEIDNARAQVEEGKKKLEEGKQQMISQFMPLFEGSDITYEDVESVLDDMQIPDASEIKFYKYFAGLLKDEVEADIEKARERIEKLKNYAELFGIDLSNNKEFVELEEFLGDLEKRNEILDFITGNTAVELMEGIATMRDSEAQLQSAEAQIEASEAELEAKKQEMQSQFEASEQELADGEAQYYQGLEELESQRKKGESDLNKAEKEYKKAYDTAMKEFADAEKKLKEAQAEIDRIPDPQWYVFDRSENPGYSSYLENVDRVDAVATVFPIFFLLVAVLVCVTTMTRLIEEKRGDIGALMTLGYKKSDIVKKFLFYSMSATILGSGIGIAVGVLVFPAVIFNAYGIIYSLPDLILKINVPTAIIGTLAALLSTSAVTVGACIGLLKKSPATLLRPKAPKPGKRILLERIGFLWRKFNFTAKVTARNIFRYKARFFMTVIGVAGCTALILCAFGLHNSIGDIIDLQFEEIASYDAIVVPHDNAYDVETLVADITSDDRVDKSVLMRQIAVTVESDKTKVSEDVYISVPENTEDFEALINLRDRSSHKAIGMTDDGAVITEKLAKVLGVSAGDTVKVKEGDDTVEIRITDICENYVSGYLYMTRDFYIDAFDKDYQGNLMMMSFVDNSETAQNAFGTEYLDKDYVLGASFLSQSTGQFREMIQSLNLVIVAVLVCAAGLAFVVLYNLTNINIAERKRELSTLKVLGFRSLETSSYIYRENIILTVIGTVVGLFLGILLTNFVITTVEVDMVMFGRSIHVTSYILAALMTLVFAAFVNVIMHFRIKKIDMIESLKSVE